MSLEAEAATGAGVASPSGVRRAGPILGTSRRVGILFLDMQRIVQSAA